MPACAAGEFFCTPPTNSGHDGDEPPNRITPVTYRAWSPCAANAMHRPPITISTETGFVMVPRRALSLASLRLRMT